MNQEQVKANLLKLHDCAEGFTFAFTGRKGRANGTYQYSAREIKINNRNFEAGETGDNLMFYTAMHELAHHIAMTERNEVGRRSHTKLFYSILDDLTDKAEALGLYRYDAVPEIKTLINEVSAISAEIATLQRKLGVTLNKLHSACLRNGVRYEDVLKRKVKLSDRTERKLSKMAALSFPEGIGFEMQEAIAAAQSDEQREAMRAAADAGKSVAQVKQAGKAQKAEPDEAGALLEEKGRIERTIASLKSRLENIISRIKRLEEEGG